LGDSVGVAIYDDQQHETISADHKPCNYEESKRIELAGGVVRKSIGK
jgi:serine/threonine protein phosphatase PrpC